MPDKHVAVVEKAVLEAGQEPKSFWVRFKTAAYKDICEKDGVLNAEFKKLGEFTNETVIAAFGAILVSMGFAATPMNIMITYLGANVIRLGVDAFCLEAVAAVGKDGK